MERITGLIQSGVPHLELLLGGRFPVRHCIVVTGLPGTGKTILCSQAAFWRAAHGHNVVLATIASESHGKLLDELEDISFFDAKLGLKRACGQRLELVITDYMVPGCTGIQLMKAQKSEPLLAHVPVIRLRAAQTPAAASNIPSSSSEPPQRNAPPSLAGEEMLNWVAHEMKSPLSAALGAAELADTELRAKQFDNLQRRVDVITRQLLRMDELAKAILDAARIQDGKLELELGEIDLRQFLCDTLGFWRDLQPEHQFNLSDGRDIQLCADRERLRQVLDNLISNAVKYGGADKVVELEVVREDDKVVISVADHGHGIPEAAVPHIFDRFHRVAGQAGRGHGLGLYIAAALTRLHGGDIRVQSELGHGSRFSIVLPEI
jgi:two-component system, sensor histidine kinase and response regulator